MEDGDAEASLDPDDVLATKAWLKAERNRLGLRIKDVAEFARVDDRTIMNLESPNQSLAGLTLLRYLHLLGALRDVPLVSPAVGRLEALEAQGELVRGMLQNANETLERLVVTAADVQARLSVIERRLLPPGTASQG